MGKSYYFTNDSFDGDIVMVVGAVSTGVQVNGQLVSITRHKGVLGEFLRLQRQGWVREDQDMM